MKTRFARFLGILLTICLLASGCGGGSIRPQKTQDKRLNVVTTLFPYYDFVRQIAGNEVQLSLVVPAGMDSHSFEPTPADMRMIQSADVLICNGGAIETWLQDVLGAMDTSNMTIVTMMDHVNTVEEELVEGMEDTDHDHDHGAEEHYEGDGHDHGTEEHYEGDGHDHSNDDGHDVEIEYDEHIWTSPANSMKIVEVIGQTLEEADASHKDYYAAQTKSYIGQLQELDDAFFEVVDHAKRHMIILGDKFPFRYFADEFGLNYRAAFSGCSSDTEPSAKTIAYLIEKVKSEQIPVIYYLELSSPRVAEIISEETGAKPLLLHSCHNVTRSQFDSGVTYLELMWNNVKNLREGLQ